MNLKLLGKYLVNSPAFLAALVVFIHRVIFLLYSRPQLIELVNNNPDWLTWQFLRPEALQNYLSLSLLYLQQSPPIPILVLGLFIKFFGWPFGAAFACVIFCGVITSACAALMIKILRAFNFGKIVAIASTLILFLGFDIIGMEYNSFGQTFYEFLAMFFMLLATYSYQKMLGEPIRYWPVILGISIGLLALSRSGMHLFFIPVSLLLIASTVHYKRKVLALFLFPVLILQGSWALKNYVVYNFFSLSTSTWGGANFIAGLQKAGYTEALTSYAKNNYQILPIWVGQLIEQKGMATWHPSESQNFAPTHIRQEDELINKALSGTNRSENSIAQRKLFDSYVSLYYNFAYDHPEIIVNKFLKSYDLFWQPIRNYTRQFLALYSTTPSSLSLKMFLQNPFRLLKRSKGLIKPELMLGKFPDQSYSRTTLFCLFYPGLLLLPISFIFVHLFLIYYFTSLFVTFSRGNKLTIEYSTRILLCLQISYVAALFNLVEYTENMRFRVMIEPLIWIVTLISIKGLFQILSEVCHTKAKAARTL